MLNADIMLPASKSISNRALIIHALAGGDALPQNLSDCNDTHVVLQALNTRPSVIDIGAAGTAMRFLTAYLAATSGTHTLTGSDRMKQRPIGILVDTLQKLGADISYLEQQGYQRTSIAWRKHRNSWPRKLTIHLCIAVNGSCHDHRVRASITW